MRKIWIIAKKEWHGYFNGPVGYVFAGLLILISNWIFMGDFFLLGQAKIAPYLKTIAMLLAVFIPAISMNLIADEKKNSTWEVVLSMPVTETELVIGKMLGCGMYLLFVIALTLPTLLTVTLMGRVDWGMIFTGYIGLTCLGMTYLAVGIFMSSLSSQPMVGFLGTTIFLIVNNMLGQEEILQRLPELVRGVAVGISLSGRLVKFDTGIISVNDSLFVVSWVGVFLILTVMSLKSRDK